MNIEEFKEFVSLHRWRFAHTMKRWPHFYTLRKNAQDDDKFVAAVTLIRSHGYDENFFTKSMRYLDVEGYKYWTMGFVLDATVLINRAKISKEENPHILNPVVFQPKPSLRNFHEEMRREMILGGQVEKSAVSKKG